MKIKLPIFEKKERQTNFLSSYEQEREDAFNKAMSEFKIGAICYCNGCDTISGAFMHAEVGKILGFHESSLKCDVYLTEREELVRVLPELVFHTKEEALKEREIYNKNHRREVAEKIASIKGTTISKRVNKYGLRVAMSSFIGPEVDLRKHDYHMVEVYFGDIDHFVTTYFAVPNITKIENLIAFQSQFEQYCLENNYSPEYVFNVSVADASNDLKKLQKTAYGLNHREEEYKEEEKECDYE